MLTNTNAYTRTRIQKSISLRIIHYQTRRGFAAYDQHLSNLRITIIAHVSEIVFKVGFTRSLWFFNKLVDQDSMNQGIQIKMPLGISSDLVLKNLTVTDLPPCQAVTLIYKPLLKRGILVRLRHIILRITRIRASLHRFIFNQAWVYNLYTV